ncbi:hypothetical protein BTUL_0126g00160 [Botrytis tulipae]|uniref:Uncharacterized protein n=1 Tax=Botrytis tulipae TaxID=87230 RepID=A0A4Z1EK66_9HELO|nr:hypothetical protein BTUL_0126g00160 [Botrytis tulipae]
MSSLAEPCQRYFWNSLPRSTPANTLFIPRKIGDGSDWCYTHHDQQDVGGGFFKNPKEPCATSKNTTISRTLGVASHRFKADISTTHPTSLPKQKVQAHNAEYKSASENTTSRSLTLQAPALSF